MGRHRSKPGGEYLWCRAKIVACARRLSTKKSYLQLNVQLATMVCMITSKQAADEIGCSVATISRWASKLGFAKKFGNSIVLTKKQVNDIKRAWKKCVGNPNFVKSN